MLESTASATIRDSTIELWIGAAADYPYRIGESVNVGYRSLIVINECKRHWVCRVSAEKE